MKRRTRTPSGVDSLTTITTRDGKGSIPLIPHGAAYADWCACFQAAITGTAAAQRSTPNPETIIRWSIAIADRAAEECQRRKPS